MTKDDASATWGGFHRLYAGDRRRFSPIVWYFLSFFLLGWFMCPTTPDIWKPAVTFKFSTSISCVQVGMFALFEARWFVNKLKVRRDISVWYRPRRFISWNSWMVRSINPACFRIPFWSSEPIKRAVKAGILAPFHLTIQFLISAIEIDCIVVVVIAVTATGDSYCSLLDIVSVVYQKARRPSFRR